MNTYKIIVLGTSGSGKTVFLASMYKLLSIQRTGTPFFLDTESEQQKLLNMKYREVAGPGTWPSGTKPTEVSEWNFICRVQSPENFHIYSALQFTYLDYAGERLTDPSDGASVDDFDSKLKNADALLGIIDGRKVLALLREEPEGYDFVNSDLPTILQIMQRSQNPVHFILTKWDLIENEYSFHDVRRRLLKCSDFYDFVQLRIKQFTVRLIPVSAVGTGFAELLPDGTMRKFPMAHPKPFQVEMPLACVLPDKFKAQIDYLKTQEVQMKQLSLSNPDLTLLNRLGLTTGNIIRFLQKYLLSRYQFEDVPLKNLLNFVEAGGRAKIKEVEEMRIELTKTLEAVRDEKTALEHSISSFLVLISELEQRYPESNLCTEKPLYEY
jgi:Double-GTPase 2